MELPGTLQARRCWCLHRVASTIATARLVSPHEFGFYATAQAATGVVGYFFTISALGSGIQRRSRLGEKTVGTALTLSLASSLVVGGGRLCWCLAVGSSMGGSGGGGGRPGDRPDVSFSRPQQRSLLR